ncbi:Holo-[acyl-carrier-protein] synthase [Bienertia sinuspersici]
MEMEKQNKMLCPRVQAKLEKEKELVAVCKCMPSARTKFQVYFYMDSLNVDLEAKSCTCRKWDLTGIPCCYAISCICFCNMEAENSVHECYKKETYMKSYSVSIPPIQDPPPLKVGPGRPRRNKRKDPYEDPKKPGRLTKHVNKPQQKKMPSKGERTLTCGTTSKRNKKPQKRQGSTSTSHLDATAQHSRTGRGGRFIIGGVGSRGGSRGGRSAGGRGKGGRGRGRQGTVPVGIGVYISPDGAAYVNNPSQQGGARQVTKTSVSASACPIGTQTSTAT